MTTAHYQDIARRIVEGDRNFAETLAERGGLDAATATRLVAFYLKHKLAKRQLGIGRISVVHGALLNPQTISNLVASMNQTARS